MLDNIFQNYKKTPNGKSKDITNDFLNGEEVVSVKAKCDDVMKQYCTLYQDTQNKYSIKPLNQEYLEKKRRRQENANSAGPQWNNMKAPELTPELKEDLIALQLKNYIDPTQFNKKNDRKNLPKFFQVGKIEDNIIEGKRYRLKKSEVKSRIAEEVLDSDLSKKYSMKKFEEYQQQRKKIGLKKSKLNKYKLKNKSKSKGVVMK
jgi:hypothetical protein